MRYKKKISQPTILEDFIICFSRAQSDDELPIYKTYNDEDFKIIERYCNSRNIKYEVSHIWDNKDIYYKFY